MNSVKTIIIDNQAHPVALSRSSLKVNKEASLNINSNISSSTISHPAAIDSHYSNIEAHQDCRQATKINVNAQQDSQSKHIKLVISNAIDNDNADDSTKPSNILEQDTYLSTLIDEYQASLNRRDCDNSRCYRFKILSYKISQTLLDRINVIKNDLQLAKKNNVSTTGIPPTTRETSLKLSRRSVNHLPDSDEQIKMDKDSLLNLVIEKNKRIEDLERLVEDQRRLRLQDASQVEEKAAKIKEWVANKLKELENQNKQLRDQNRKQKEAVESLSTKLATMSPISSPRRNNTTLENVRFIDQSSPIETIDVDKSLKTRRPQLKAFQMSSSSEDDNQSFQARLDSKIYRKGLEDVSNEAESCREKEIMKTIVPIRNNCQGDLIRGESPVYDSVTFELTNRKANMGLGTKGPENRIHDKYENETRQPPPPPLHQSDKWELQLYSLADQTFSTLMKQQSDEKSSTNETYSQPDSVDSNSDKDISMSRKSSSSMKNDLISLVKPTFTTIDGDHVIDSIDFNEKSDKNSLTENLPNRRDSNDQSSQSSSLQLSKIRKDSVDSYDNIDNKPMVSKLFDSPMRSRAGKDSILRTQSVRRNPAPEKLYDFISADLIKRGNLVKPGALKSHTRWFVLKNFHLYSYKCEADETTKGTPNMKLKLEPSCQVQTMNQTGDFSFPFKITYLDKTLQLIANTAQVRDEWIRILTAAINMSDIEQDALTKLNSAYEGILSVTRHGHTKRCYATLVNHVLFFLKSLIDPTPVSYLSVRGSKIREITDNYDYDSDEQELLKQKSCFQDCSLAIYPKFSLNPDPVYITLGSQYDTDKWFHFLSKASGLDQSYGTQFERNIVDLMIKTSMSFGKDTSTDADSIPGCLWKQHSIMIYSDRPINQPLTSLTNETLRVEAIELFKSMLLFTQVPLEPVAIDYHICLLQNCLSRFLKYPELRNEFYAQLIKQCTYVVHRCNSPKLSSSSSGCSLTNQTSSMNSLSPTSSECRFVTDVRMLDSIFNERNINFDTNSTLSQLNSLRDRNEVSVDHINPPSQSELLQVFQILAVAVSLNLPRGRMRWWLMDHLRKFSNPETNIGKYALYTLKAIQRTIDNGPRENVPSRTEIMSILLRNPHDHSKPHSLPVSFADGSYLVVEADGSTTVHEFMSSMTKDINIRHSLISDFYLFADDPSGSRELHILESQRKVLDVVGWWEQTFRRQNSGRYQNTKAIKLICKKRLILRTEEEETAHERLLIVHQVHQEIVSQRITLSDTLNLELGTLMAQLTFGDIDKSCKDPKLIKRILEKIYSSFIPNQSSQQGEGRDSDISISETQLINSWQHLSGRSAQDCVRVYLNCIRRLNIGE